MEKKLERIFCIVIGILLIFAVIGLTKTSALFPTTLFLVAMEFFGIGYSMRNNKEKYTKMSIMYTLGIVLVIFATFYTVIKLV